MRRLAGTLAGRRPFAVEAAIGTTEHESRGLVEVEPEIAGLLNRSTDELRLVWRQLHRAGPPVGLSRDLLIRALAYDLQKRTHGDASAALRRRLHSLAEAPDKGALAVDRGIVPKAGTTLVRQWRGHTHTVLVQKDGFEHEGQRYRSLTVIAERITGAHWSGPRFFGLTRQARASLPRGDQSMRGRPATARVGKEPSAARSTPANPPRRAQTRIQFAAGAARGL